MDNIINFIADNYIWFIVIGLVILMTIIGYLADKTDFASKKMGEKIVDDDSKAKKEEVKEDLNDISFTQDQLSKGLSDFVNKKDTEVKQVADIEAPLTDTPIFTDGPVNNDVSPVTTLNAPVVEEMGSAVSDNVPQELFAPLTSSSGTMDDQLTNEIEVPDYTPPTQVFAGEIQIDTPAVAPIIDSNVVEENSLSNQDSSLENVTEGEVSPVAEVPPTDNVSVDNGSSELVESPVVENNSTDVVPAPVIDISTLPQESIDVTENVSEENKTVEEMFAVEPEAESIQEDLTNSEYEKMFPDDPIIINESGHVEEQTPQQEEATTAEDIWKF